MKHLTITSTANPRVKNVAKLRESKHRRSSGQFIVEGSREISRAIDSGLIPISLFICEEIAGNSVNDHISFDSRTEVVYVNRPVFGKMVMREDSDGVLAVFHAPSKSLSDVVLPNNPIVLIVAGVEKPGNLGAILRTADGAGAALVVVVDEQVDVFSPNVVRASLGAVFTVPVVTATSPQVLQFCQGNHIRIFCAEPAAVTEYFNVDLSGSVAFVLGSEARGLEGFWRNEPVSEKVCIPMRGRVDSLNVSVSSAVLLYEALRQRASRV